MAFNYNVFRKSIFERTHGIRHNCQTELMQPAQLERLSLAKSSLKLRPGGPAEKDWKFHCKSASWRAARAAREGGGGKCNGGVQQATTPLEGKGSLLGGLTEGGEGAGQLKRRRSYWGCRQVRELSQPPQHHALGTVPRPGLVPWPTHLQPWTANPVIMSDRELCPALDYLRGPPWTNPVPDTSAAMDSQYIHPVRQGAVDRPGLHMCQTHVQPCMANTVILSDRELCRALDKPVPNTSAAKDSH